MWSFFTPLLFLLLHVRVSDRDTDLVSLGVAACCVTLLHPHFLFVVAVVYTAACRVVWSLGLRGAIQNLSSSYFYILKS